MVEDIAENDDALEAARDFVRDLLPRAAAAHARECRRADETVVRVPIDIRTRLLDAPPGLVPALLEVIRSPEHAHRDTYVACAVDLLAVLEAREALPALLEVCVRDAFHHDTVVHDAVAGAIRNWDALDEVLAFGRSRGGGLGGLPFVLAGEELYGDKVLAWLVDMLPRDPPNVALGLQCTGDIRAIPHLRRQLVEIDPSRGDWANCVCRLTDALAYLLETLMRGETLTPEERALRDRAIAAPSGCQEPALASVPAQPDPCPEAVELSLEIIEPLARDGDAEVRWHLIATARPPAHVIHRLLADNDNVVRLGE